MSSTVQEPPNALPPTTNTIVLASSVRSIDIPIMLSALSPSSFLDADQRIRLIKSTRKLGKVLGTTPRVERDLASLPSSPTTPYHAVTEPLRTPLKSPSSVSFFGMNGPKRSKFGFGFGRSFSYKATPADMARANSRLDFAVATDANRYASRNSSTTFVGDHARSELGHGEKEMHIEPPVLRVKPSTHSLCHRSRSATVLRQSSEREPTKLKSQASITSVSSLVASHSSGSSDFSSPTTPMDSELNPSSANEQRRRKMDKLTRTLGEQVPAELVFPDLSQDPVERRALPRARDDLSGAMGDKERQKENVRKTARRASISVVNAISTFTNLTNVTTTSRPPTSSYQHTDSAAAPAETLSARPSFKRRASAATSLFRSDSRTPHTRRPSTMSASTVSTENWIDISAQQPMPISSHFVFSPPVSSNGHTSNTSFDDGTMCGESVNTHETKDRSTHSTRVYRSMSVRSSPGNHWHRPSTSPSPGPRSDSPFVDTLVPLSPPPFTMPVCRGEVENETAMRKERRQGWSGEWNRDNMQDIIKQLRELK